jgi:hypothetical protein
MRSTSGGPPGSPEPLPEVRFADERLRRWLLVRGRGDKPLGRHVDGEAIRTHSSSKRPSIQRGDTAVLYAAVWQAIFGVVEIVGYPENDPSRTRWAWRFAIRPLSVVDDLDRAPPVESAGIFPQSLWRHSHIRLTDEQFECAAALVREAARDGVRRPG